MSNRIVQRQWSLDIPMSELVVVEKAGEESASIRRKEIVLEEEVPEGYTVRYDGYDIYNSKLSDDPETVSPSGSKVWDDLEDADGLRPDSITIRLLADGTEMDQKLVTAADNWQWTFEDLPKYRLGADGQETEIVYSFSEDPVDRYTTSYDGSEVINRIVSQVSGYDLNLKGRIGLNVYLFIPQRELVRGGAYVTLNGEQFPVESAETRVVDGVTLYKFTITCSASQMNDKVTVRLYDSIGELLPLYRRDEDVTDTGWTYKVQTYIDRVRESSTDPLLLDVVNAMSDFGSLAQAFFGHNELDRAVVVGDVEAVTESDLQPYAPTLTKGKVGGVSYQGSGLVLRSGTVIRHYFSIDEGSVDDYTFKVGSKVVTPIMTENGCMVEISDIYAAHLDNVYSVTVTKNKDKVLVLRYSALSYAYKAVQKKEDQKLVLLAKAL